MICLRILCLNGLIFRIQRKIKILGSRSSKQIEIIDKAINEDNIKSMIALIEYQGIGFYDNAEVFSFCNEL